jgi:hypothetical protein
MSTYEHRIDAGRSLTFETSEAASLPTGTSAVLIEGVKRAAHGVDAVRRRSGRGVRLAMQLSQGIDHQHRRRSVEMVSPC